MRFIQEERNDFFEGGLKIATFICPECGCDKLFVGVDEYNSCIYIKCPNCNKEKTQENQEDWSMI